MLIWHQQLCLTDYTFSSKIIFWILCLGFIGKLSVK